MHDRSKEKNNPTTTSKQAHLSSNKRTGPFIAQSSLSTSRPSSCNINNNTTVTDEQQHRIALRAAKAMEKQLRRRQDRRSMFVWGDRKKVHNSAQALSLYQPASTIQKPHSPLSPCFSFTFHPLINGLPNITGRHTTLSRWHIRDSCSSNIDSRTRTIRVSSTITFTEEISKCNS